MNAADEIRAVVRIEESAYEKLLGYAQPGQALAWGDYCAFVEKCLQKGLDRAWPVKVYEATEIGMSAFLHATGRHFDTAAALAYAEYLLRREPGNH